MTIEQLRKSGWIIYEVLSGSHAYGTATESSDKDYRGVYIQPTDTMLGLTGYMPQISDDKNDVIFYEIGRFLELASKGNPNIMELLNMPEENIIYKSDRWNNLFPDRVKNKFITTKLKHTFLGFAHAQIKKAKGLNKKINWDESKMKRKDVLDFCYVITVREDSTLFKHWSQSLYTYGHFYSLGVTTLNLKDIGLAKVNNVPDLYSMYYMKEEGGIINENSNDVQLRSIPKDAKFLGYMRFDKNAYSSHCKDYAEYQKWIKNRNEARYEDTISHGQNIDGKNMLHVVRLLNMAKDIGSGKGVVVKRPEAKELLEIRKGKVSLQEIIGDFEKIGLEIRESFDNSNLPKEVNIKWLNKFLTSIRLKNLK